MKNVILAILVSGLVSCVAQQQQQAFNQQAARNAEAKLAFNGVKSFCEHLLAGSQLDPIRSKAVISNSGRTPPTFDMLASEEHVSPAERPPIRDWANIMIQVVGADRKLTSF